MRERGLGVAEQSKGQVVGYVRVSAADQNEARQVEAIGDVDKMFLDKASGKNAKDRPELQKMIEYVREGDTVIVKSPDRLARSTTDLLDLVKRLGKKGVEVTFLDNPALNTNTPHGEFMLTVLGAVAQLERSVIGERQMEGIALAKKRGVYERRRKISDEQIVMAQKKVADGVPKAVVARELGVSRTTLYAALEGMGRYAESSVHASDAA